MIRQICEKCGREFEVDPWIDDIDLCKTCKATTKNITVEAVEDTQKDDSVEIIDVAVVCDNHDYPSESMEKSKRDDSSPTIDVIPSFGIREKEAESRNSNHATPFIPLSSDLRKSIESVTDAYPIVRWTTYILIFITLFAVTQVINDSMEMFAWPKSTTCDLIMYLGSLEKKYGRILPEAEQLSDQLIGLYASSFFNDGMNFKFPIPMEFFEIWVRITQVFAVLFLNMFYLYCLQLVVRYIDARWLSKRIPHGRYRIIDKIRSCITWYDKTIRRTIHSPNLAAAIVVILICPIFSMLYIMAFPGIGSYSIGYYFGAFVVLFVVFGIFTWRCLVFIYPTPISKYPRLTNINKAIIIITISCAFILGLAAFADMTKSGAEMEKYSLHIRDIRSKIDSLLLSRLRK